MNSDITLHPLLFVFLIIGLLTAGIFLGSGIADVNWKADAIKHKAAHYDFNSTNGTSTWNWN
jgi:hypothetical protein